MKQITYGVIQRSDLSITDSLRFYEVDATNPTAALNKVIREDKSDRYRDYIPDGERPLRFRNSYSIYEQNGHSLESITGEFDDFIAEPVDLWTELISDIAETY